MRDSRVFDFPLILAMLGMTLAGCAGLGTGGEAARGPAAGTAQTAAGETGALNSGMPENQELPGLAPAGEAPPAEHPAARAILRMAHEAMVVLSDASLSADRRAEGLRRLMARDIEIAPIARFVLGRYWRTATEGQRRAYVAAYSDYILNAYTTKIGGAGAALGRLDVIRTEAYGTRDFLVHSVVARAGNKPMRVIWRVRRRDGRYRIIDLIMEGVSMVQSQRQEFVSMIRASGGDVDKLIATLKQRTI